MPETIDPETDHLHVSDGTHRVSMGESIADAEQWLKEILRQEDPRKVAADLCSLSDEIQGKGGRRGYMNQKGAVEMLEEIADALSKILTEHEQNFEQDDRKLFEMYKQDIAERVQRIHGANERVVQTRQAVRDSRGGLRAYVDSAAS